ncbi:MAG: SPASM domain-containing protein [Candidatus Hydrogenedens sp.]|nr:SPASM domain-containing protein [Candidatus Hydrogenedens sp.]
MDSMKPIHRFEKNGRYFAVDIKTPFCFECDKITFDVLEYYPEQTQTKILNLLASTYTRDELLEVWGELEWLRAIGSILKTQKIETWANTLTQTIGLHTISFLIGENIETLIKETIPLTLLRAIPHIYAQTTFKLNFFMNPANIYPWTKIQKIIQQILQIFITINDKKISINLCIPLPEHIYEELKINKEEKIFIVFEKITNDIYQKLTGNSTTDIKNVLNESYAKIWYLPENIPFTTTVEKLQKYGTKKIVIDLFAPFILNPNLNIHTVYNEITNLSHYYAQQLIKRKQSIIEPFTELFKTIQQGNPVKRKDPAGAEEWFIADNGDVFGSYLYFLGNIHKLGNIYETEIPIQGSESIYRLGILATSVCSRCWAQNFCGGGCGAVHYCLTGKVTEPQTDWCNAHRKWIEDMIFLYQELNNSDALFTFEFPIKTIPTKTNKLTVLKHIFRSFFKDYITIRPLKPQDETWLSHWETWNTSLYFTMNEGNILTTTQHEKEQDILTTNKTSEEFVITDKKSNPRGLLRIQPHKTPNLSTLFIYFHNPEDYDNTDIIEGFQLILEQIKTRFPENKWLVPVSNNDEKMKHFLEQLNFKRAGQLRDAIFFHNQYHPVDIYII